MKLNNVIEGLYVPNSLIETCEVHIVYVNSMNQEQNELFHGTVKEMAIKYQNGEAFGAGIAEDWYVVGYNYVAYTVADECLPIFTRPIEIRVI